MDRFIQGDSRTAIPEKRIWGIKVKRKVSTNIGSNLRCVKEVERVNSKTELVFRKTNPIEEQKYLFQNRIRKTKLFLRITIKLNAIR